MSAIEGYGNAACSERTLLFPIETAALEHRFASQPLFLAAEMFVPDGNPKAVLVCLPGETFTKSYFHPILDDSYSFGQYMAREGYLVIALDHLGCGESAHPVPDEDVTLPVMASANAWVVRRIRDQLRKGTLHERIPPLDQSLLFVGLGHSMGAQLALLEQASERSYDALALLGWSNTAISLGGTEKAVATLLSQEANHETTSTGALVEHLSACEQEQLSHLRVQLRPFFYGPFLPEELMAADEARMTRIPSGVARDVLDPQTMTVLAAGITVPLFLANGGLVDRGNVRQEAVTYPNCCEITVVEVPGSAHCHNFSSNRRWLWERCAVWIRGVEALARKSEEGA